jgi:hypothetical protein
VYWFAGFAVLALVGGFLGLVKPVRRAVGRFRPVADPARRRGSGAAGLTTLAILGSSAMAGVGGVLIALHAREASVATDGVALTGLALGTALLGGTSAFGRRGGVFGTLLAVTLVVLTTQYAAVTHRQVAPLALVAGAIGVGLIVTRLVETFGRPRSAVDDDAEDTWRSSSTASTPSTDTSWSSRSSGSGWTSPLPARSGDDSWGRDDRWGSR